MKYRVAFSLTAALMLCGAVAVLYAQSNANRTTQSGRIDLKAQTLVGKTLTNIEELADGRKAYHYVYRVQARPTEQDMPRYTVDPQYNVSYELTGFQADDSIRLRPSNRESQTDSPIWIYDVVFVDSGTRLIEFDASGSIFAPTFTVANDETENCFCTPGNPCGCGCVSCNNCNCQILCGGNPGCSLTCNGCNCTCHTTCPSGCTCEYCRCTCEGCLNVDCVSCPKGCFCDHCGCLCLDDIDHSGVCGCPRCTSPESRCRCDCHVACP